jgi:2-polyprenyl-3-methyl-5-hydroxy-6-metoxy-1,4-benzoquinol methylase
MINCTTHICCPLCQSHDIQTAIATHDYSITQQAFDLCDCLNCGIRFTQPMPDEAHIGAYYQSENYISHSDTKEGIVNRLYHMARQWMLNSKRKMAVNSASSSTLLDVGSGTGYFLQHMLNHGYQVLGVEVDEGARSFAQQQFGLDVRTPDELTQGKITGPFGLISMWHVLEHVHDPKLYLTRLYQLLEPGGLLLIAVPNYTSLDAQHYRGHWAAYDVPRHLWHFSPKAMTRLVDEMGFKVIQKKRLPLDPFYVALLSEKYLKRGVMAYPLGAWIGLRSTFKSWMNTDRSSSIVYFLKKA